MTTNTQTQEVPETTASVLNTDPFLSVPFPGLDCRGWLVWDPSNRNEEATIV